MKWLLGLVVLIISACNEEGPQAASTPAPQDTLFPYSKSYVDLEQRIQVVLDSGQVYERNPNSTFDLATFTENTTRDMVHFITRYNGNPDSIRGLEKNAELGTLRTYSYGYWSGGTRGFVPHSILTVGRDSSFLAANLAQTIEARFDTIIQLSDELYLLFGTAKAYSNTHSHIAYVVRITEEIDTDYPAFVNRPFLNFYNGTYTYDRRTQLLSFQSEEHQRIEQVFSHTDKYGNYAKDALASQKLYELIRNENDGPTKRFQLQFINNRFERVK